MCFVRVSQNQPVVAFHPPAASTSPFCDSTAPPAYSYSLAAGAPLGGVAGWAAGCPALVMASGCATMLPGAIHRETVRVVEGSWLHKKETGFLAETGAPKGSHG